MTRISPWQVNVTRQTVLLFGIGLALAVWLGVYASPAAAPPGMAGRVYPRVAAPAPDLRTLLYLLGVGSTMWFAAVAAVPVMVWLTRRVPSDGSRRRTTTMFAASVLGLFVLSSTVDFYVTYRGAPTRPTALAYLPTALKRDLLPWITLVGLVVVAELRRRSRVATLEHARLRALVAEQRLVALTGQLQPHFLFNTLQAISTLIHRDADAADEMLAKLSDLLRDLLQHRDQVLVSLDDELRYTRTYLEIAELRFADRLTWVIEAPEVLHAATVPLFLLQPLVENALAHGIGPRAEGGRIVVSATRERERLVLEVRDDGVGYGAGAAPPDGVGLGNTRLRLAAAFGADQRLTVHTPSGGGCVARVDMPYREQVRE